MFRWSDCKGYCCNIDNKHDTYKYHNNHDYNDKYQYGYQCSNRFELYLWSILEWLRVCSKHFGMEQRMYYNAILEWNKLCGYDG